MSNACCTVRLAGWPVRTCSGTVADTPRADGNESGWPGTPLCLRRDAPESFNAGSCLRAGAATNNSPGPCTDVSSAGAVAFPGPDPRLGLDGFLGGGAGAAGGESARNSLPVPHACLGCSGRGAPRPPLALDPVRARSGAPTTPPPPPPPPPGRGASSSGGRWPRWPPKCTVADRAPALALAWLRAPPAPPFAAGSGFDRGRSATVQHGQGGVIVRHTVRDGRRRCAADACPRRGATWYTKHTKQNTQHTTESFTTPR